MHTQLFVFSKIIIIIILETNIHLHWTYFKELNSAFLNNDHSQRVDKAILNRRLIISQMYAHLFSITIFLDINSVRRI